MQFGSSGCSALTAAWKSRAVLGCLYQALLLFLSPWSAESADPVGAPWRRQVENAEWVERDSHGLTTLGDGSILVMGGWNGFFSLNDVWQSSADDAGKTWQRKTDNAAWSPRKFFATAKLGDGSVLILGGYDGHFQYYNDVWRTSLQAAGASWTLSTAAASWSKRSQFSVVAFPDDSLLVLGGCCYHNDVWRSKPGDVGASWTLQMLSANWTERADLAATVITNSSTRESLVMVLGGTKGQGMGNSLYMHDVWLGNANGTRWVQRTAAANWSGRAAPSVVALSDGSVLVMAGTRTAADGRTYVMDGDVWRSSPESAGAHWVQQTAVTGWFPRIAAATLLTTGRYAGRVLLAGGFVSTGARRYERTNDVWRTDLPCLINSLAPNSNYGSCPAAPDVLESDLTCEPSCHTGYTSHSPYSCADGQLTTTTCDPDPCDASSAPANGRAGNCTSVLPSGAKCQPECSKGYTVSGLTTCLLGKLFPARCLPDPCPLPQALENGHLGDCGLRLNSSKACQPTCSAGYTVSSPASCYLGVLKWPMCNPNPCYNASLPPEDGYAGNCPEVLHSGSVCQNFCDGGFTVSNEVSCWLGNLTRASCLPDPCNVTHPPHAMRGNCPEVLESGSSCTPICEHGYDRFGTTSCYLGQLSTADCIARPCKVDASLVPLHGVGGDCPGLLQSGHTCQPVCDEGYTVTGPLLCFLGNLSKVACLPNSCDASKAPAHGTSGNCKAVLPSDSWCLPTCNSGYTLSGPTSCRLGNITLSTCLPNPCEVNNVPLFGDRGNCPIVLQSGEQCQPTCADGYSVSGPTVCFLGNLSSEARCDPNPCNESMAPENGMRGDCPDVLPSGSVCQPACMEGYTVTGPSSCFIGNMTHATCAANPCYNASIAPLHGNRGDCPDVLASGSSCQPQCDIGYSLSTAARCQLGHLDVVTCISDTCNASVVPAHGNRGNCPEALVHGDVCQPQCDPGYTVIGIVTCFAGNLTHATCMANPCHNASTAPLHGDSGDCPDVLASGELCQPRCDIGYAITGVARCWLGHLDEVACVPSTCNASFVPAHGNRGDCPDIMSHGDVCQPQCEPGYTVSGPMRCYAGNLTTASCFPNSCNVSTMPLEHGSRGSCPEILAFGASCRPECDDGYTLSGLTTCLFGLLEIAECSPTPCNVSFGLVPNQHGLGDCPSILPSGMSCLLGCQGGFTLSHPLSCHLGALGIANLDGTLHSGPAPLPCHPGQMPACIASPCLVGNASRPRSAPALGFDVAAVVGGSATPLDVGPTCPAILPSGATCVRSCQNGYRASGRSLCFLGEFTAAPCVRNEDDPWWTTTSTTATILSTTSTTTRTTSTTLAINFTTNTSTTNFTSTLVLVDQSTQLANDTNISNSTIEYHSLGYGIPDPNEIRIDPKDGGYWYWHVFLAHWLGFGFSRDELLAYWFDVMKVPERIVVVGVSTKTIEEVMVGTSSVVLADMDGFSPGMPLTILGDGNTDPKTIVNVNPGQTGSGRRLAPGTVTVDSSFKYNYPIGVTVAAQKVQDYAENSSNQSALSPDAAAADFANELDQRNDTNSTCDCPEQPVPKMCQDTDGANLLLGLPIWAWALGAGMMALCSTLCALCLACALCRERRRRKGHPDEEQGLVSVGCTIPPGMDAFEAYEDKFDMEHARALELEKEVLETQADLSKQRSLCISVTEQLKKSLALYDQAIKDRDSNSDWGASLQQQLQQKEGDIGGLRDEIAQLEARVLSLSVLETSAPPAVLPPIHLVGAHHSGATKLQLNTHEGLDAGDMILIGGCESKRVVGLDPPLIDSPLESRFEHGTEVRKPPSSPGKREDEAEPLLSSHPEIVTAGPEWEQPLSPPSAGTPLEEHAMAKVRRLLEGSFVQALPGMQLAENGVEHCRPGDIGTVYSYCPGEGTVASRELSEGSFLASTEASIHVQWTRTRQCTEVLRTSWVWFRFIRTPEPKRGDFLQALPGAEFVDDSGVQHYRAGDVGEVVSVNRLTEPRGLQIVWPRSGKTSEIPQGSWTWFRVFRAPSECCSEAHDSTSMLDDLIASGDDETCFSVVWIRVGQTAEEPKAGDIIQIIRGCNIADHIGTTCYQQGEVGKVMSVECSADGSVGSSLTAIWMSSGQTSIIRREYWHHFRVFRMQEPKVGDLLVATPAAECSNVSSSEHYAAGDSGSVLEIAPAIDSGVVVIRAYWGRTGEVTECPLSSWSTRFSLIPLQSNVPSYIRFPLGSDGRI